MVFLSIRSNPLGESGYGRYEERVLHDCGCQLPLGGRRRTVGTGRQAVALVGSVQGGIKDKAGRRTAYNMHKLKYIGSHINERGRKPRRQ